VAAGTAAVRTAYRALGGQEELASVEQLVVLLPVVALTPVDVP
jgi:hypothetical protein